MLDTSVAIMLRDAADPLLRERLEGEELLLSAISLVELEGGVYRKPSQVGARRNRLDVLLETLILLPFGHVEAGHYGRIVAKLGYSRPRVIDRMIAAHALALDVPVLTANPADFAQVPGLKVEAWTHAQANS